MNVIVKNLVKDRIQEIEYLLDMNEIGRDLLPATKIDELAKELKVLNAEMDSFFEITSWDNNYRSGRGIS